MLTAFLPFDSTLLLLVSFLSALLPQVLERYPPHVRKDTPGQKCLSPQTPRKCSGKKLFCCAYLHTLSHQTTRSYSSVCWTSTLYCRAFRSTQRQRGNEYPEDGAPGCAGLTQCSLSCTLVSAPRQADFKDKEPMRVLGHSYLFEEWI